MLKLPRTAKVVEVGSWKGKSGHALASGLRDIDSFDTLYCIDTFKGALTNPTQMEQAIKDNPLEEIRKNLREFNVNILVSDSAVAANEFEKESIDFLFLDANHDYEYVIKDIDAWLPKIKPGGIICGHDYREHYKGVKQAVDEKFSGVKTFPDSIWYFNG